MRSWRRGDLAPTLTPGFSQGQIRRGRKGDPVSSGALTNVRVDSLKEIPVIIVTTNELSTRVGGADALPELMIGSLSTAADKVFLSANAATMKRPVAFFPLATERPLRALRVATPPLRRRTYRSR